jgi:hypothetical protein
MSAAGQPHAPPEAPQGHRLAQCEPLHLSVTPGAGPALKGSEVAHHAGLKVSELRRPTRALPEAGELAGAMVLASFVTSLTIEGRSYPTATKLIPGRPRALRFTDGDTVRFTSCGGRDGGPAEVTLWPYVAAG